MLGYILPIAAIFATIFTIHRLVKNNEIIILFNSGMSFMRISLPLLVLSMGISIGLFFLNEIIVSPANYEVAKLRSHIRKNEFRSNLSRTKFALRGKEGIFYDIGFYDDINKIISNVVIEKFEKKLQMNTLIMFKKAEFTEYGWLAEDVYIKSFVDDAEVPVAISQPIPTLLISTSELPSDFGKESKTPDEMNARELSRFIKERLRAGSDVSAYIVEYQMRFSFPLLPFILSLLGLSLCIKRPRVGFASIVGYSLGISFGIWGMFAIFKSFGVSGKISPYIAAWMPIIMTLAVSAWILFTQQRKTFK